MDVSLLSSIASLEAGVFDFLLAVGVLIVALTVVRKADPAAGYVLGGAMGVRFLGACCTRAFSQVAREMSFGESEGLALAALSIIRPWFDLMVWCAVIYVLVQLTKKISPA
jgi:hypothetical protein